MASTKRTRPMALAYCRVSTLDQAEHGASLDAQEATLRAEAERRGWEIEVIREEGKSAKSIKGRPLLSDALRRLDAGQADNLLSVRLDRVSRSVVDFAGLMERSQRKGWGIVFTATNIDTTDASGRFSAHIHVAAAEFERALISTRTKEGLAQRKAEGVVLGRQVEDAFLPTYKRVLAMHAEQMSLNAIARVMNDEGVPTSKGGKWYASTVRAIVTSETAETVRRVLALREVGTDATTIAREVGISKTRVYGILGENLVGVVPFYAPGESEED